MRNQISLSRRQLLILASSSIVAAPLAALADGTSRDIHVVKNPQCGCCTAWIKILTDKGFNVTTEDRSGSLLTEFKIESGIPKEMMSCHTAKIDGYFIEGHVPASDIKRLIADRPDALGLAVPAMPYGSPGMGPEDEREAYDVYIIGADGTAEVFQHYSKAGITV
ncbi:DUF411 domain-containing protein [Paracoccaceae bacterium]|nr:DUF411 domain-containing protein [Paracoccaceae bacterium]